MLRELKNLTIKQFGALFTLRILNASLVEEFLKQHRFAKGECINSPDWIIFLTEVISRCQGAGNHPFLITHFLQPAFDGYTHEDHCKLFLNDLIEVSLKVHGLFAVCDKDNAEEERNLTVSHEFKKFLIKTITMDSLLCVISAKDEFYDVSIVINGHSVCYISYYIIP